MTLLEMLGIDRPIIQAPMAGVSTPIMAAAVANAGALGSIGVGASTAQTARESIAAFRASCKRALNVNVFCHQPLKSDSGVETAWLEILRWSRRATKRVVIAVCLILKPRTTASEPWR